MLIKSTNKNIIDVFFFPLLVKESLKQLSFLFRNFKNYFFLNVFNKIIIQLNCSSFFLLQKNKEKFSRFFWMFHIC